MNIYHKKNRVVKIFEAWKPEKEGKPLEQAQLSWWQQTFNWNFTVNISIPRWAIAILYCCFAIWLVLSLV
jgi:hypothetical protein